MSKKVPAHKGETYCSVENYQMFKDGKMQFNAPRNYNFCTGYTDACKTNFKPLVFNCSTIK